MRTRHVLRGCAHVAPHALSCHSDEEVASAALRWPGRDTVSRGVLVYGVTRSTTTSGFDFCIPSTLQVGTNSNDVY